MSCLKVFFMVEFCACLFGFVFFTNVASKGITCIYPYACIIMGSLLKMCAVYGHSLLPILQWRTTFVFFVSVPRQQSPYNLSLLKQIKR